MREHTTEKKEGPTVAARLGVWLGDRGLTALLGMLILELFLLPIFGPDLGTRAINVVFSILFVTGVAALSRRRLTRLIAVAFSGVAITFRWLASHDAIPFGQDGATATSVVALGVFTVLVFLRTLSPGPITRHRIEGAVATYLLIGVMFAQAFELTERLYPGSFEFPVATRPEQLGYWLSYFSTVTLTTVGYGDVTPVTPTARALSTFEGVFGQLYPVIILGWMVSSLKTRPSE